MAEPQYAAPTVSGSPRADDAGPRPSRRAALLTLLAAPPAAAAGIVGAAAQAADRPDTVKGPSPHVQRYYELARY